MHGVHEVNLNRDDNVAPALLTLSGASRAAAGSTLLLSEELLELFKYVAEGTLSAGATLATSKLLVLETFEAREAAEAASESAERVSSRLLLLVTSHASTVVDALLALVSERLIRLVDLSELFLGTCAPVHIGMVFFSFLEIRLLDVNLRGTLLGSKDFIEVFAAATVGQHIRASEAPSLHAAKHRSDIDLLLRHCQS